MAPTLAERLAGYAHQLEYDDLTDDAVSSVKTRLLDSLGCCYAAFDEPAVQQVVAYARQAGGDRTASVIGQDWESSVEAATLANGALIRYVDWNDTHIAKEPGHPSDNLATVLSVADAFDRDGKDAILAAVLAYEVQCRLNEAAILRTEGFDHVNYGLVSSSLAAGKLVGLTEEELVNAVRIAVNGHVALRQARSGQYSPWKGIAFANAARNAVVAARLAGEGVSGPAPIFEGEFGFFAQVSGEFQLDVAEFGRPDYRVERTYIKLHPVAYSTQAAADCALRFAKRHEVEPGEIESIENETFEAGVSITGGDDAKWRPETRETADHSMPYCVARALLDGELTLESFDEEKLTDPEVRRLMDVIEVTENESFTEAYPDPFRHAMTVHTADQSYEFSIEYPRGHQRKPLSAEEIERKFRRAASPRLDDERIETVLDLVLDLERFDQVSEFLTAT